MSTGSRSTLRAGRGNRAGCRAGPLTGARAATFIGRTRGAPGPEAATDPRVPRKEVADEGAPDPAVASPGGRVGLPEPDALAARDDSAVPGRLDPQRDRRDDQGRPVR